MVALKAAPQPEPQQQTEEEHRPQSVDLVVDNTHEIPAEPAKPPFAKESKLDSCIIFLAECGLPQYRHRTVHFDRFSKVLGTRISDLVAAKAAPRPESQQQTEEEHRPQSVELEVVSSFGQPK